MKLVDMFEDNTIDITHCGFIYETHNLLVMVCQTDTSKYQTVALSDEVYNSGETFNRAFSSPIELDIRRVKEIELEKLLIKPLSDFRIVRGLPEIQRLLYNHGSRIPWSETSKYPKVSGLFNSVIDIEGKALLNKNDELLLVTKPHYNKHAFVSLKEGVRPYFSDPVKVSLSKMTEKDLDILFCTNEWQDFTVLDTPEKIGRAIQDIQLGTWPSKFTL